MSNDFSDRKGDSRHILIMTNKLHVITKGNKFVFKF